MKSRQEPAEPIVDIDTQNAQLEKAAKTKDRRIPKSRWLTDGPSREGQKLPGKKFDEWYYKTPDGEIIRVPVQVVKDNSDGGRRHRKLVDKQTERTYFQVVMPDYAINEADTDIDRLRQTVFKAMEIPFKIVWQTYFLISFVPERHDLYQARKEAWGLPDLVEDKSEQDENRYGRRRQHKSDSLDGTAEFKLEIEEWDLGTTKNGRQVSRRLAGRYGSDGDLIRKDWPQVGENSGRWFGNSVSALVLATPENRAGLEEIVRQITLLQYRLFKLLHPDNVQKALLTAVQHTNLLPSPATSRKGSRSKPAKKVRRK